VAVILNKNKSIFYSLKNSSLSSLKWYITFEMVTYGYFFIELKKKKKSRIHPV